MKTPLLDKRNYDDIIEEMKNLVPNYTPEWNFNADNPDAGSSLFMVYAMQIKETIDLLNRSLDKNFISYLNMSNIVLQPPKSSKVPVVFTLTSDDVSVYIKKGTKLTSSTKEGIVFETESDLEVIPVKIKQCFFANDLQDKIIKCEKDNFSLFDYSSDNNIQLHEMYIIENSLLNINGPADIIIRFSYDNKNTNILKNLAELTKKNQIVWEYYTSENGYVRFDDVQKKNNTIVLKKKNNYKIDENSEFNSRVIRVSINEKEFIKYENFYINRLDMQTKHNSNESDVSGIRTESLFYNEKKLDSEMKLPFGNSYNVSDYFFVGCDEVFTKPGANIKLDMELSFIDSYNKKSNSDNIKWKVIMKKSTFEVSIPPIVSINDVEWRYYNGVRWEPLNVSLSARDAFYCKLDDTDIEKLVKDINNQSGNVFDEHSLKEKLKSEYNESMLKAKNIRDKLHDNKNKDNNKDNTNDNLSDADSIDLDEIEKINNKVIRKKKSIGFTFVCPDDFNETEIGGQTGYFIRCEIKGIENNYEYNGISMIPVLDDIQLNYDFNNTYLPPISIFTNNNNEIKEYTYEFAEQSKYIKPFYGVNSKDDCLYICINNNIKGGPVNLLFLIEKIDEKIEGSQHIKAEYLTHRNNNEYWKPVNLLDGTNGLTKTGIITLLGTNDFVRKELFAENGYWIRIFMNSSMTEPRIVKDIYFNAMWAIQQCSVIDEFLNLDIDSGSYTLFYTPVLQIELWVNEIEQLNKIEIDEIINLGEQEYITKYDELGILKEFWVKWKEVNTFFNNKPNDRVYIADRQTGLIMFGNNVNGKKPPLLNNTIKVNYVYGGGEAGNINAYSINGLYESKAFIDKVFNPIAAVGGVDSESLDSALKRGTKYIKHKNKAISVSDIQNIIIENFNDIKDVKCAVNRDEAFKIKNGHINIIILPKSTQEYGVTNVLKDRIRQYLGDKLPAVITDDKLHITGVRPIKINVKANILCSRDENPYHIKMAIEKQLSDFLDYNNGNFNHVGWRIGEIPKKHAIFSVISKVRSVNNTEIKNLTISYNDESNIIPVEMSAETVDRIMNGIIVNGKHDINIIINDK